MQVSESQKSLLLSEGNTYKTKIEVSPDTLSLTQRSWLIGLFLLIFSSMGFGLSVWFGIVLCSLSVLYMFWVKKLEINLSEKTFAMISGIYPFVKKQKGSFADIDHVELRQIRQNRTTGGNQYFGKWIIWDVNIHLFKGKMIFSVWEEGNEEKTKSIAQTLSEILECEIKEFSNIKK